jgi:hypothetical protein
MSSLPANSDGLASSRNPIAPEELVSKYLQFREVNRRFNTQISHTLSREALFEGARRLGLLADGTFVFDDESQMETLNDFCLYHVRPDGMNAVQRYFRDNPPPRETAEWDCLKAMCNAFHSVFRVDSIEPRVAVQITDLATQKQYLLVDRGLSTTGEPGLLVATGLVQLDDFAATTGAPLIFGTLPPDNREEIAAKWRAALGGTTGRYDPAPLIREIIHREGDCRTHLANPVLSTTNDRTAVRFDPKERKALRSNFEKSRTNARCRCGSGKLFRNCCMKKQQTTRGD